MDIEHRRAVDATLWDIIFDRQEQERISAAASPVDMATLYFSLKESYYKMQHPLTRRFLDFLDVRVEEGPAGLIINRLKALPEATPGHRTGHLLTTDFVVTWVLAEP
jgi:4'-phosphopantetheinyl transferase EntD